MAHLRNQNGNNLDDIVKSHKLSNVSFTRKRQSSNYKLLQISDHVGNDKAMEFKTFLRFH